MTEIWNQTHLRKRELHCIIMHYGNKKVVNNILKHTEVSQFVKVVMDVLLIRLSLYNKIDSSQPSLVFVPVNSLMTAYMWSTNSKKLGIFPIIKYIPDFLTLTVAYELINILISPFLYFQLNFLSRSVKGPQNHICLVTTPIQKCFERPLIERKRRYESYNLFNIFLMLCSTHRHA